MAAISPTAPQKRHWIENLTWVLIYGGLLAVVLGLATGRADEVVGWSLGAPGAVAAMIGLALIWVRSLMKVNP